MAADLYPLQTQREETIQKILAEGEWIGADTAPRDVAGWQQRGWIFGVQAGGRLYFARYQFDDHDEPRPVIREILAARNSAPPQIRGQLPPAFTFPAAGL